MASDFEKVVLQEKLTSEVVECLLHEAHENLERAPYEKNPHEWAYHAFVCLGMVRRLLEERFDEIAAELHKKARWNLYEMWHHCKIRHFCDLDFSERVLLEIAEKGLAFGRRHSLPDKMGKGSINYGFVAEMFLAEFAGRLRYIEGDGWEVRDGETWKRRAEQRGIVGLIYEVMRRKVHLWKRALADGSGVGGWLEELERNINNPDWLRKVEEMLLLVDHFGVEIVSSDA
jgi:hypothetical protein